MTSIIGKIFFIIFLICSKNKYEEGILSGKGSTQSRLTIGGKIEQGKIYLL